MLVVNKLILMGIRCSAFPSQGWHKMLVLPTMNNQDCIEFHHKCAICLFDVMYFQLQQVQVQTKLHCVARHTITNYASRLVCRNDPEIKWLPQSTYYA